MAYDLSKEISHQCEFALATDTGLLPASDVCGGADRPASQWRRFTMGPFPRKIIAGAHHGGGGQWYRNRL
jgi:hypothetical protein